MLLKQQTTEKNILLFHKNGTEIKINQIVENEIKQ